VTTRNLLLTALALLLAGCAWHAVPAQTVGRLEPTESVLSMDRAAWKLVGLERLSAERVEDDRLEVELELTNLSDVDVTVQVRCVFRNEDGSLTTDEAYWKMVVLPRSTSKRYTAQSLDKLAASYQVEIRTP